MLLVSCYLSLPYEVRFDILLVVVPKKWVVDEVSADEVPPEAAPKRSKKRVSRRPLPSVDEDKVVIIPMDIDEPPAREPAEVVGARISSRMSSPELRAAGVSGEYAAFDGPEVVPEPRSKSLLFSILVSCLLGVSRSWRVRG